jgi:L-alanine-DL-glutamate epimerase-like enolase superfamily enzyme
LNSNSVLVRLDTNKGISGYGECRCEDTNVNNELRTIKPLILGMNPTQVQKVFDIITAALNPAADWKNVTYAGGAVAGIECACWDITGKVYNVPIWQLIGPKLRDGVRMYADTSCMTNVSQRQSEIQKRIDMGFTWFKTDLNSVLSGSDYQTSPDPNPFTASGGSPKRILDSGFTKFMDYVASYRKMIGDAPLSADHFFAWSPKGGGNQLDVASAITLANYMALPQYMDVNLGGWMEDIIPWHYYAEMAQIRAGGDMPILTGEDMFGLPDVMDMVNAGAIDYFHPDPATFGGIQVSRLAADWAYTKGVKTALHMSSGPIALAMNLHIAAGIPEFLSCEHHYADVSWYDSLIDGLPKPLMQNGYIPVPDGPGLGVTLNETALKSHLAMGSGYFTSFK